MDARERRQVVDVLRAAASALLSSDFAALSQPKNKWRRLSVSDLRRDPELQDELFELIQNAYRPIGGHFKLRKPLDLLGGEVVFFDAVDIDDDPQADALSLVDTKPAGEKYIGMGHDDKSTSKKKTLDQFSKGLRKRGVFAEMSGALAHVMLTRYDIPTVDDPEKARRALKGKKIEWLGAHPDGKYPNNLGWYYRKFGASKHMKILVGRPRV